MEPEPLPEKAPFQPLTCLDLVSAPQTELGNDNRRRII